VTGQAAGTVVLGHHDPERIAAIERHHLDVPIAACPVLVHEPFLMASPYGENAPPARAVTDRPGQARSTDDRQGQRIGEHRGTVGGRVRTPDIVDQRLMTRDHRARRTQEFGQRQRGLETQADGAATSR